MAPKKEDTHQTQMTAPDPAGTAIEQFSFDGDEGGGFENQTMADRKLPMIVILQSNSPQVAGSKGAIKAGQFYNTVTEEVLDEVYFVGAVTSQCHLQFIPRDDGGGFRGRHPLGSKIVADAIAKNDGRAFGKIPLPQPADPKTGKPQPTNELVETFEVYAITIKDKEITGFAVIPFSSTKIKAYRNWNTQLGMFAPTIGAKKYNPGEIPLFAHRVKMTSFFDTTNPKGSYFVPVLEPANGGDDLIKSMIGQKDPRYQAAKKLRDDVLKGAARAAYETMTQEAGPDPEANVPF